MIPTERVLWRLTNDTILGYWWLAVDIEQSALITAAFIAVVGRQSFHNYATEGSTEHGQRCQHATSRACVSDRGMHWIDLWTKYVTSNHHQQQHQCQSSEQLIALSDVCWWNRDRRHWHRPLSRSPYSATNQSWRWRSNLSAAWRSKL